MPNDPHFPASLQQFIREHITSGAQLEALLLIAIASDDAKSGIGWTVTEVTAELRSERNLMATALRSLAESGLLVATEASSGSELRYRYVPATDNLRASVEAISRLYRERRHVVLGIIYAPPAKPPSPAIDSARAFSDAFRLRKPNSDRED